jgi:hypothetical protein
MSAHTPGPWSHSYRKGHDGMNRHEVYDKDGETIATLAWYPVKVDANTTTTNRPENASLIAAAPDGLDAAREALIALVAAPNSVAVQIARRKLKAFIAKATGSAA